MTVTLDSVRLLFFLLVAFKGGIIIHPLAQPNTLRSVFSCAGAVEHFCLLLTGRKSKCRELATMKIGHSTCIHCLVVVLWPGDSSLIPQWWFVHPGWWRRRWSPPRCCLVRPTSAGGTSMESDLTPRMSGGPGGLGRRPGRGSSPGSGKSPARCKGRRLPDSPPLLETRTWRTLEAGRRWIERREKGRRGRVAGKRPDRQRKAETRQR